MTSKFGYPLNYDWKHPWPRAPTPSNETDRLEALHQYQILDSDPDEKFDKLCRIACKEMQCPIAAISFIDRQKQWFKANSGLTQKQIPRDVALCAHTIMHPKRALVVEDTSLDERFKNNPLVTRASAVRFYAGVPITTSTGHCIGSVFVFDVKTHTKVDPKILHKIAAKVLKYMDERLKTSPVLPSSNASTSANGAMKENVMPVPAVATRNVQTPGETSWKEQAAPAVPAAPAPTPAPTASAAAPPVPPQRTSTSASLPPTAPAPAPTSNALVATENALQPAQSTALEVGGGANQGMGNMGSMLMNLLARTTETQQQLAAQQGVMFETLGQHSHQLESLNDSMDRLERRFEQVQIKGGKSKAG